MKLIIGLMILMLSLPAKAIEQDKQKHFVASALISSVSYAGFRYAGASEWQAFMASVAFTLAIGHAKESTDDFYDGEDMVANGLGAVTVPLIWMTYE